MSALQLLGSVWIPKVKSVDHAVYIFYIFTGCPPLAVLNSICFLWDVWFNSTHSQSLEMEQHTCDEIKTHFLPLLAYFLMP